jgi:hypothetical protein
MSHEHYLRSERDRWHNHPGRELTFAFYFHWSDFDQFPVVARGRTLVEAYAKVKALQPGRKPWKHEFLYSTIPIQV